MPSLLNNSSAAPLYLQIVANIRYKIDSGALKEGDRLPSEGELCELYQVSRITIRRATNELTESGYLEKKQGRGTFVKCAKDFRLTQSRVDIEVASFSDACRKSGHSPGSVEIATEHILPDEDEQKFFNIGADIELLSIKRVRTADNIPIMFEENHFPLSSFSFLENTDLTNESMYEEINRKTGAVIRMIGTCVLTSDRANGEIMQYLQVPGGEPLFVLDSCYGDQQGNPVYTGRQLIVGARYSFAL